MDEFDLTNQTELIDTLKIQETILFSILIGVLLHETSWSKINHFKSGQDRLLRKLYFFFLINLVCPGFPLAETQTSLSIKQMRWTLCLFGH